MGVGLLAGRRLGDGGSRGYVFGGLRRMWTEVATGGVNPANGEAGEDRDTHERRPWTAGAGITLDWKRPVDIRVRYSQSYLDWIISQGSLRLDYRYNTRKVSISVGVGISS